jgi:SagB-type dehydrogenase family enzyme
VTAATHQTVTWAPWVWGADEIPLDDPAETFHEASRLYASVSTLARGASLLVHDERLRASIGRATKRAHGGACGVPLPEPALSDAPWEALVASRRSRREFAGTALALPVVSALLHAAYGVTHDGDETPFRATPWGGALYPLELYAAAAAVDGLDAGVYHFDPLRNVLEVVREGAVRDELACSSPYSDLLSSAPLVIVIASVFWRTRFKYGLRGYRFALLEAGHVGQSLVLAAAAHGLAAVPVGGFYDRRLDALVGADGLDEAVLYAVAVGSPDG